MKKIERLKKNVVNFLYDHIVVKEILSHLKYLILSLFAAFVFALGFTAFITPHLNNVTIATGGVSGLSQIVAKIFELFGVYLGQNIIQGIGYSLFNLPLLIFSFIKIGKKFSLYSAINVAVTSLLVIAFSAEGGVAETIGKASIIVESTGSKVYLLDSILVRVIFASFCTGISSAVAFVGDFSCGGIDIITYYLGLRKSTQVGKYGVIINVFVVSTFSILTAVKDFDNNWASALITCLYSLVYLFLVALVIDMINLRNKKVEIKIITKVENMGTILIANFPHGATMSRGQGVYTKNDDYIFYMVVSTNEYKKVVRVAKKIDAHCFITVSPIVRLYGNFFSKPIE